MCQTLQELKYHMKTVDHIQESEWRLKRRGNIEIFGCFTQNEGTTKCYCILNGSNLHLLCSRKLFTGCLDRSVDCHIVMTN